jgi:hypothetical protein
MSAKEPKNQRSETAPSRNALKGATGTKAAHELTDEELKQAAGGCVNGSHYTTLPTGGGGGTGKV